MVNRFQLEGDIQTRRRGKGEREKTVYFDLAIVGGLAAFSLEGDAAATVPPVGTRCQVAGVVQFRPGVRTFDGVSRGEMQPQLVATGIVVPTQPAAR